MSDYFLDQAISQNWSLKDQVHILGEYLDNQQQDEALVHHLSRHARDLGYSSYRDLPLSDEIDGYLDYIEAQDSDIAFRDFLSQQMEIA